MIVLLEKYGDFDMKYVDSVWVNDMYSSLSETGLDSTEFDNDRDVNNAKKRLKELGFKKVKTGHITVGGNL